MNTEAATIAAIALCEELASSLDRDERGASNDTALRAIVSIAARQHRVDCDALRTAWIRKLFGVAAARQAMNRTEVHADDE